METQIDSKATPAGFGPGKSLRQARLDLRLSPEDVAQQLHLAPRQILALENDDYEQLPQATYVRGYLRNYALLLGLSPEPILESYARMHVNTKLGAPVAAPASVREAANKNGQIKFAIYAIAAVVVVLAASWWQARESANHSRERELKESDIPLASPANSPAVSSDSSGSGAVSPQSTTTMPPVASPENSRITSAPQAAARPAFSPAASPRARAAAAPSMGSNAPVESSPATPPLNANPGSAHDLSRARIVLRAYQDSWVEIDDATHTRLFYQILAAGKVIALEGVPPLQIDRKSVV